MKNHKTYDIKSQIDGIARKYTDLVKRAEAIARLAHEGQKRKSGGDYIQHPRRVAAKVNEILFVPMCEAVATAWLHDVLEDTDVTAYDLEVHGGFPIKIVKPIQILTRLKTDNYFQFIMRIRESSNTVAIAVKMADLDDNMSDLKEGSLKDKYRLARFILQQRFNAEV